MGTESFGMAVRSIAAFLPNPEHPVTNDEIAQRLLVEMDRRQAELGRPLTRDEASRYRTNWRWIEQGIGFTGRFLAPPGVGTIDLATGAAELLLEKTGLDRLTLDRIVFATVTPSYLHSPPDAAILQNAIGLPAFRQDKPRELGALNVSLACCSWVAALMECYAFIRAGMAKHILLVGADAMNTAINWGNRTFACVLGDAGTAMELVAVPEEDDWFSPSGFYSWCDGSRAQVIMTPKGGSRDPLRDPQDLLDYRHALTMDGPQVREDMVPFVGGPGTLAALEKAGLTFADLGFAVLHQANLVLNTQIVERWRTQGFKGVILEAGPEFANTTSASIPLALARRGKMLNQHLGQRCLLVSFGGGYTYASSILENKSPVTVVTNLDTD